MNKRERIDYIFKKILAKLDAGLVRIELAWKTLTYKGRLGDILVSTGTLNEFDIITGEVNDGTLKDMKLRAGYRKEDTLFFIQIVDRKTIKSMRIYLTPEQYVIYTSFMAKIYAFEQVKKDKN
jgi:hypothetical protein